jgi:ribosomal protein S18 acetylase RimI-like enzyme
VQTEGVSGLQDQKQRPAVCVRTWRADDIPIVRDIAWQTWRATYGSFIPVEDLRAYHDVWYTPAALRALLQSDGFTGLLLKVGEIPAGFARIRTDVPQSILSLSSMYVLPGLQGLGGGKALLYAAEDLGRRAGLRDVWLGVMVRNSRALSWYRTAGFRFVRLEPFRMGSTTVDHLIGFKPLGSV